MHVFAKGYMYIMWGLFGKQIDTKNNLQRKREKSIKKKQRTHQSANQSNKLAG